MGFDVVLGVFYSWDSRPKKKHPGFYTPIVLSTEEEWERLKPVKPVGELVKK